MIYAMIVWTSIITGHSDHGTCTAWINAYDVSQYVELLNEQYPDLVHTYEVCKET